MLRSRNLPGVDFRHPGEVLAALNRAFAMESQNNLYFTMWYGVVNKTTRQLRYSSAGHPPALLIAGTTMETATVEKLKTSGAPIGTFPESPYTVQATSLRPFNRLFVFSDGAYGNVKRIQQERYGNRLIASDLQNPDFCRLAESFGIASFKALDARQLEEQAAVRAAGRRSARQRSSLGLPGK